MEARHRAFIAPRLLGSLVALAAFPVYLIMRGVPSALEVAVFAWLIVPILIAYFLSRTGRYEGAHVLSSLSLTGLVAAVALQDRRIVILRRDLAGRRSARSRACRRRAAWSRSPRPLRSTAAGILLLLGEAELAAGARDRRRAKPARSPRSASFRLRFMQPASRSARNRSRAPASGCSTPRKTVTGCSRAT